MLRGVGVAFSGVQCWRGCIIAQVQTFEDPSWPQPPPALPLPALGAAAAAGTAAAAASHASHATRAHATPPAPQQVTWTYTQNLPAATAFLAETLGFPVVLDQGPCTVHSVEPGRSAAFLGVCDSRPAPQAETPPATYTLVTASDAGVGAWHAFVARKNATNATAPALVAKFNVFAFEWRDWEKEVLGWYRLSCQHFEDPGWPRA